MTLEELKKQTEELQGNEEIKKLHRQYVYSLNSHQWAEMVDCFTENANSRYQDVDYIRAEGNLITISLFRLMG